MHCRCIADELRKICVCVTEFVRSHFFGGSKIGELIKICERIATSVLRLNCVRIAFALRNGSAREGLIAFLV